PIALVLSLLPALALRPAVSSGRRFAVVECVGYLMVFGLEFWLLLLARSRGPFVAAPIGLALALLLLLRARRARLALAAAGAIGSLVVLGAISLPLLARTVPAVSDLADAVGGLGGPSNTIA